MSGGVTTAHINGKNVTTGDKIVDFRGQEFTFDYVLNGYVYTKERPNGFISRVFPEEVAATQEP